MVSITQLGGYNVVHLRRGRELVPRIPNNIVGWHQAWWFIGGAWQLVNPSSPLGIRMPTNYAIRVEHHKFI